MGKALVGARRATALDAITEFAARSRGAGALLMHDLR